MIISPVSAFTTSSGIFSPRRIFESASVSCSVSSSFLRRCSSEIDFSGGFFPKDRAQQALFRRQLGFALRCNFAHENIPRLHFRTDPDNSIRSQVAQRFFAYVRDVARDFLRAELGVARADLEFIDVNRS